MDIKFTKWVLSGAPDIAIFIINHYEDIAKIIENGDKRWYVGETGKIYDSPFDTGERMLLSESEMFEYLKDVMGDFNLAYYIRDNVLIFDEGGCA